MSIKIAQYKFDAITYENLIPEFNDEFTESDYVITDSVSESVIDDIKWESGAITDSNGVDYDNDQCFRTIGYISVNPNTAYKFSSWGHGFWFDADKNLIEHKFN